MKHDQPLTTAIEATTQLYHERNEARKDAAVQRDKAVRLEAALDAEVKRNAELERCAANWERKYDRVRAALDPMGRHPEHELGLVPLARYTANLVGMLVRLALARETPQSKLDDCRAWALEAARREEGRA